MTKKEAIELLEDLYGAIEDNHGRDYDEAFRMAIEALSAPQTDLINRGRADAIEAIQNAYCKPCKERGDDYNEVRCRVCEYDNAIMQIDALPLVDRPQGEWILVKGSNGKDYHKCSKCLHTQEITDVKNYCAVCGARNYGVRMKDGEI